MKKSLKQKKVALYDPYLDVLGGGEEHILSIIKVLNDRNYSVDIFWNKDVTQAIIQRFNLSFRNLRFLPSLSTKSSFQKLFLLKKYDYFFYVTDGSYFFSSAKNNIVFSMIPKKELYRINFFNRLKLFNYSFVVNSKFTQNFLKKWGIKSQRIYPYVKSDFFIGTVKKEKIILSVGRFFSQLHSKNHLQIIRTFKKLKKNSPKFKDFKLVLVGGLKKEDESYFDLVKKERKGDKSITLLPNVSYKKLLNFYKKSLFYWHFTGFSTVGELDPAKVEHLGITPLQAMASKCIVFAYNAGGPKEIIDNGRNGFLFKTEKDLLEKMNFIIGDIFQQKKIINKENNFVKNNFSKSFFENRVIQAFKI